MGFLRKQTKANGSTKKRNKDEKMVYDWSIAVDEHSANLFDYREVLEVNRKLMLNKFEPFQSSESYPAALVDEWIALVTERDRVLKLLFIQSSRIAVKEHLLAIHCHLARIMSTIQATYGRLGSNENRFGTSHPQVIPAYLASSLFQSSSDIQKFLLNELNMNDEDLVKIALGTTPFTLYGTDTEGVENNSSSSIPPTPSPSLAEFGGDNVQSLTKKLSGNPAANDAPNPVDLGAPLATSSPSPPLGFCADSVAEELSRRDENDSMVVDGSTLEDIRLFSRGAGVVTRTGARGHLDKGLNEPLDSPLSYLTTPSSSNKRNSSGADSADYVSVSSSISETRSFRSSTADSSTFGDRRTNGSRHSRHGQRYFPASLNFPSLKTTPIFDDAETLKQKKAAIVEDLD